MKFNGADAFKMLNKLL